jgi:hypothetical protein
MSRIGGMAWVMNGSMLYQIAGAKGKEFSMSCSRGAQEARVSAVLTGVTTGATRENIAVAVAGVEVIAAVETQVRHHAGSDGHGSNVFLVILDCAEESTPAVLVVVAGATLARWRTRWHWGSVGINLLGGSLEVGKRESWRTSAAGCGDGSVGLDLAKAVVSHDGVGTRVTSHTVATLGRGQGELVLRVSVQKAAEAVATVLTRPWDLLNDDCVFLSRLFRIERRGSLEAEGKRRKRLVLSAGHGCAWSACRSWWSHGLWWWAVAESRKSCWWWERRKSTSSIDVCIGRSAERCVNAVVEGVKAAKVGLLDRRHRALFGLKIEVAHSGSWRLLERRCARMHSGSQG